MKLLRKGATHRFSHTLLRRPPQVNKSLMQTVSHRLRSMRSMPNFRQSFREDWSTWNNSMSKLMVPPKKFLMIKRGTRKNLPLSRQRDRSMNNNSLKCPKNMAPNWKPWESLKIALIVNWSPNSIKYLTNRRHIQNTSPKWLTVSYPFWEVWVIAHLET